VEGGIANTVIWPQKGEQNPETFKEIIHSHRRVIGDSEGEG